MSPPTWDIESEEIIARDGDLEEPPAFVSGHDAFLDAQASYEGYADAEAHDE